MKTEERGPLPPAIPPRGPGHGRVRGQPAPLSSPHLWGLPGSTQGLSCSATPPSWSPPRGPAPWCPWRPSRSSLGQRWAMWHHQHPSTSRWRGDSECQPGTWMGQGRWARGCLCADMRVNMCGHVSVGPPPGPLRTVPGPPCQGSQALCPRAGLLAGINHKRLIASPAAHAGSHHPSFSPPTSGRSTGRDPVY